VTASVVCAMHSFGEASQFTSQRGRGRIIVSRAGRAHPKLGDRARKSGCEFLQTVKENLRTSGRNKIVVLQKSPTGRSGCCEKKKAATGAGRREVPGGPRSRWRNLSRLDVFREVGDRREDGNLGEISHPRDQRTKRSPTMQEEDKEK